VGGTQGKWNQVLQRDAGRLAARRRDHPIIW
jgi:hypothetical protein